MELISKLCGTQSRLGGEARQSMWPSTGVHCNDSRVQMTAYRNLLQARLEIPTMCWLLDLPKGGRILEIGCGQGNALPHIARLCEPDHLAGIDLDTVSLQQAAGRAGENGIDVSLHQGDVRDLPFPDGTFDMVIDFGTCYHITEPERVIGEIVRVLTPGGLSVSESRLAQFLAHPRQFRVRTLPWHVATQVVKVRHAGLWSLRRKITSP